MVGDYEIQLETREKEGSTDFVYSVWGPQGVPAFLEDYLGAKGHSVLLTPSGEYIHTHAAMEGETPVFTAEGLTAPYYRVYTEFQIEGQVLTAAFDWSMTQ
jgi:hypothetical protein